MNIMKTITLREITIQVITMGEQFFFQISLIYNESYRKFVSDVIFKGFIFLHLIFYYIYIFYIHIHIYFYIHIHICPDFYFEVVLIVAKFLITFYLGFLIERHIIVGRDNFVVFLEFNK